MNSDDFEKKMFETGSSGRRQREDDQARCSDETHHESPESEHDKKIDISSVVENADDRHKKVYPQAASHSKAIKTGKVALFPGMRRGVMEFVKTCVSKIRSKQRH